MAKKSLSLKDSFKKEKAELYLKRLKDKLNYYKKVVINSSEAVIIQDFEGVVKAWNKSAERIYGFKEKEMLGRNITAIIAKKERAEARRNIEAVKKGKPSFKIRQLRMAKSGQKVFVNITYSPIYENEELIEIGTTEEDISELKKSLEVLKGSEERFKELFNNMDECVAVYKISNNGQDVIIKDFNKAAEKLEKIRKKDIIGKKVDDVFKGVKEFGLYDIFKKVWKTGKPMYHPISFYKDAYHKGWRENFVFKLPSGEIVAIYSDVTEKMQAQEKIKEIAAKNNAILASIGDGLIATDNKGEVIFVNQATEKMLGWSAKEIIGKLICDICPTINEQGTEIACGDRPLNKIISSEKVIAKTQAANSIYYLRKDKTKFPVSITITPIILDKKLIGAVEVFRDITKEKEVDKAKTEFVSLASHQLQTPLSAIKWHSEMLLNGDFGEISEKQRECLKEIYDGNKRMLMLVNALLNVSRLEMGTFMIEPEPVKLRNLAEDAIGELKIDIERKKIALKENLAENLAEFKFQADPKLLNIVLQNLFSNAVKYTAPGGKVELEIKVAKKGEMVDRRKMSEDSVAIIVADNGCGIPKSQQDRIFSELFRADNARTADPNGTGLGLYIVKSVVDHANGAIWFRSVENVGTTFYVIFPLKGMKKKEGKKEAHLIIIHKTTMRKPDQTIPKDQKPYPTCPARLDGKAKNYGMRKARKAKKK